MNFIRKYRQPIFFLGCALIILGAASFVTGCSAPTFLTDLEAVIPTASLGIGGILTILGGLLGNPTLTAVATQEEAIAQKIDAELDQVNTLIESYKNSPDDTTLGNIESGINEVVADLKTLGTTAGLPAAQAATIQNVVSALVQELEAVLSVIPILKGSTAGQTIPTVVKPLPKAQFKAVVKAALHP